MPATSKTFPHLVTPRLVLRAPAPQDAPAFREIMVIAQVTRFSNWPDAMSKAQSERYMRWMAKLHASGKGCAWMIERREDSRVLGALRFNVIDKKWRWGQIGYELAADAWGKGLMSEAVAAAVACGHDTFCLNRIEAWTLPGNGASDRVLEKAGFSYEGTLRQKARFKGAFHDFRIFGRLAGDPRTSVVHASTGRPSAAGST